MDISAVDLSWLWPSLADDIRASVQAAVDGGAVLWGGSSPDEQFRSALASAVRTLENRDRDGLIRHFLRPGPIPGVRPHHVASTKTIDSLSDAECAAAIRYVYCSVINAFKGALAELLALGPVARIAQKAFGHLSGATVAVGDVAKTKTRRGRWAKGADLHVLERLQEDGAATASLLAVAEVKSYAASFADLKPQLDAHLARAHRGLAIRNAGQWQVVRPAHSRNAVLQIALAPDRWPLPRTFRFEQLADRRVLQLDDPVPPRPTEAVVEVAPSKYQVTFRWSVEALASVAYDMTSWYLGEVGSALYAEDPPDNWRDETREWRGRNAAKLVLHYAILRARTPLERSRAVALYNAYCFGYGLGSNFVDQRGRRQVLFPEHLEALAQTGYADVALLADDGESEIQRCRLRQRRGRAVR